MVSALVCNSTPAAIPADGRSTPPLCTFELPAICAAPASVPPAATTTLPGIAPDRRSTPPSTVVWPVWFLLPVQRKVPVPVLRTVALPLLGPLSVVSNPFVSITAAALNADAFASTRTLASKRSRAFAPSKLTGPVPNASEAALASVPATTEVPPLKLVAGRVIDQNGGSAAAPIVWTPVPCLTSRPAPISTPSKLHVCATLGETVSVDAVCRSMMPPLVCASRLPTKQLVC